MSGGLSWLLFSFWGVLLYRFRTSLWRVSHSLPRLLPVMTVVVADGRTVWLGRIGVYMCEDDNK